LRKSLFRSPTEELARFQIAFPGQFPLVKITEQDRKDFLRVAAAWEARKLDWTNLDSFWVKEEGNFSSFTFGCVAFHDNSIITPVADAEERVD